MVARILTALAIILVIAVVLKLFKLSLKWVIRFVLNAVIGVVVLYLLNYIPHVSVPLNWWTTILTGIFGLPAVLVILIVSFFI